MALGGDAWGRPHHRRRGPSGHRRRGGHP
jgi:hypothetical protein